MYYSQFAIILHKITESTNKIKENTASNFPHDCQRCNYLNVIPYLPGGGPIGPLPIGPPGGPPRRLPPLNVPKRYVKDTMT